MDAAAQLIWGSKQDLDSDSDPEIGGLKHPP